MDLSATLIMSPIKEPMLNTTQVDDQDIWVMLMSTIRYAMGRRDYMPSLCSDLIQKYHSALTAPQLKQIKDEIQEELLKYERFGKTLGDKTDDNSWRALANDIVPLIEKAPPS